MSGNGSRSADGRQTRAEVEELVHASVEEELHGAAQERPVRPHELAAAGMTVAICSATCRSTATLCEPPRWES